MDRYEFAPNEYVNALECVTLETLSTDSGSRDFIAVGTSIDRGEDLAVKGAVSNVVLRWGSVRLVLYILPRPTSSRLSKWYLTHRPAFNDGIN